jgi:hypothetical protein
MTELEKLAPEEPDFQSFSDWKTNNSSGDPIKDRVNWGNYVREAYVSTGSYDDYIEKEIRDTTKQRLVDGGLINADDTEKLNSLFDTEETDLDTKLKSIQSTFDYNTPEWEAATKYLSFKEVNPEGTEVDESVKQRGEEFRAAAQSVADRYYDDAKKRMSLNGEIPIAKVMRDGKADYIIGPSFDSSNLADAIRNSKKGDVSFADAAGILAKVRIPKGYTEEAYKVERYREAMGVIDEVWGKTSNSIVDRFADKLADADRDGRTLTDAEQPDFATIRKDVNKLLPENEGFSEEEIKKAFTQSAYIKANNNNKFEVYDDEEVYKNVRNVGFAGPLVNPAIMANEDKLIRALDSSPDITKEQRSDILAKQEAYLQSNFDFYNKKLTESEDLSEKWLNTLQSGRASGKKDYQILKEFSKDKDNFSEMSARISGIVESVQDGFGELVAAIPMLAGNEMARDYMIGNIKERSDRREISRLFGVEFGMGQDFMEAVAPMLTDVGATALLSFATAPAAGAGGAAFASAKAGARLTAKGLMKSLTSNALRQLPDETMEQAAKRVLAAGLIKESTAEAGTKGAMTAIKAYNSSLASTVGATSAMALPAFNRSAGSTYAAVYSQLQQDGKLTPEQIHDRALGAGLTSGAITAAITAGFGSFGRGGLEDALLGGATKKQVKNILTKLSKVDDISDEEFNKVVATTMSDTMKKFSGLKVSKEITKNSFDEGAEEALDQFINGFVSDAATDQDTPFLERLEQAGRAAIIGGVMGGSVPALKAIKSTVASQSTPDERLSIELQFAKDISDKLAETSPISAQTVRSILTAPRSGRAAFAATKLAEARAKVSPPSVPAPIVEEPQPTEGITVKEEAGVDSPESSPTVLAPVSLVSEGKPVAAEPQPEDKDVIDIEAEVLSNTPIAQQRLQQAVEQPIEEQQAVEQPIEEQQAVEQEEAAAIAETETPVADTIPKADENRVQLIQQRLANITPEDVKQALTEVIVNEPQVEEPLNITAIPSPITDNADIVEPDIAAIDNVEPTVSKSALPEPAATATAAPAKTKAKAPSKQKAKAETKVVGQTAAVVETPANKKIEVPRDSLSFNREDETNIVKNAESQGIDNTETVKHVRKTMAKMGLLVPEPEIEPEVKVEKPVKAKGKKAKAEVKEPEVKPTTLIGEALTDEVNRVVDRLVEAGAVVRIKKSTRFGLPTGFDTVSNPHKLANDIAQKVFEKYKPLSIEEVSEVYQIPLALMGTQETSSLSWWNPFTMGYQTNSKIKYRTVIDGGKKFGLFDNNPLTVAAMLKRGLPVYIPSTFTGEVNKAIKVDKDTGVIYDVRFPDPAGGPEEFSIVETKQSNKQKPVVAEVVSSQLELLDGLKPPLESTIEVQRDLTNLAELKPKEGSPTISYYEAIDQSNKFFGSAYSNIGNVVEDNKKMVGASRAFLKLLGFSDPKKQLTKAEVSNANEIAMIEIIPEFQFTLFKGEFFQTLERNNAIVFDSSKARNQYSINTSEVGTSRNLLLERIKVPQDFKLPEEVIGKSEQEIKAYFLLSNGFKKGETLPVVGNEKVTSKNLNAESANTVLDQFIFNTVNDQLSRPDDKGMFPNVGGIIKRVSNRVLERIKYEQATAKKNDLFDRLQIDADVNAGSVEFNQALAEMFDVEEASFDSIHSSLDSLKAENVWRGVRSSAEKLLRTDPKVAASIRSLAKETVFASDPSLADNMYPVKLFSEVALWASQKKSTAADSFRFRRKLLDHFPVATEGSSLVHDAFELSGAFAYNFKRVADKQTTDMLVRNGLTRAEADFVLEKRNLKRIVEETGVTEQEADSIMKAQLKAQSSYAAPSFINAKYRKFYRSLNQYDINRLGLESGNTQSVLEAVRKIAKNGKTEQNRAVAQLLLRFPNVLRDTQFVIVDADYNKAGLFIKGVNGTNVVVINTSGFYGVGVESVILHEYLHAITVDVLTRPEASLTPAQRGAKTRLNGLMQLSVKAYNESVQKTGVGSLEFEAATVNLEEFVATFFSSPEFQKQLKVLRQTGEKARSFFARIYDAILDIFGIKQNSSIDKAFDDLVDLASVGNTSDQRSVESLVDKSLMEARNNGARRRIVPSKKVETDGEIEARLSSFEGFDAGDDASPEHQEAIDILINQAVRSLVPANVDITIFDTQKEADDNGIFGDRPEAAVIAVLMKDSTGRSVPSIFINRANMRSALLSRNSVIDNPTVAKGILESIFNEELTHIAEFYALSTEEVDAVASTMSDTDFDEIINNYTSVEERRDQLKIALRGSKGDQIKNQLVGEMLRMHSQKITRGYTSEEDIAFFESNPSVMSIAFRYLRGVFRRMYARYNLNKNNPELAAAIHNIATELRFLQDGTYNLETHSSFDPNNPEGNVEILRQRFSATMADITEETSDEDIMKRFKGLFDSLELPVALYKRGEYQHMSTKWQQWVKGDVDPRVSRLYKQQKFFEQATDSLGKSMMSRISKLIKETYGDGGLDPALLSAATGTTEFTKIDKQVKQKIQQDYRDAVKQRKDRAKNGEIDPKWVDTDHLAAMYKAMVKDRIADETRKLRDEVRAKQAAALQKISQDSPKLAAALVEMRKLTDAMSKTIKNKYNLSETLQVKFDNNMGIYLTRAYRAFNEEGYIEKVLESKDPKFVEIRQEASVYFRSTYIKRSANSKLRQSINNGKITGKAPITKEQALELATDEVDNNPSIVAQFMAQFLRSYSPEYRSRAGILPKGVTKSLINNLRRKSDLDPAVRKLLGEYEQETEGVNNLLRTYSVVTTMVARQSFYTNLIEMARVRPVIDANNNPVLDENGEPVQDGFLLTEDDLRERMKKNPMLQQEYVNIRTGKVYTPDTKEEIPATLEGQYDPTYNYYGPKEMVDAMRRMYTPPVIDENLTGAQRATSGMVNMFNTLTGLSLAVKTLGSIPFYLRNIASNMFFFAPSQGFYGYDKMFKSLKLVGQTLKDTYDIDAYRAELISLGILNNEMQSSMIKEMLDGKFKMEAVNEEIDTLSGKIKSASAKGVSFVKPFTDKLQALSASVDGFYKMAYFENELNTLKKAKQEDIAAGNKDSFFARLTENEMKREAARKVLATAQSYSEAPPIVQETVRSVGMFVAPFLRFKTEVPRIMINTFKEAWAEMKSGNPVIRNRGIKRAGGMTSVLVILSAAVPEAIRLFLGIGEDEDEALRATVPHYLRDNTFFYFTWGGKLKSVDFTFLNPYSTLADPVLRAGEHIFRGEPEDAVVSFSRAFFGQYLDEQIFTGALVDVMRNKDSSTGQNIYYNSDGIQIFSKSFGHIIAGSFVPRTLEKSYAAINSVRGESADPSNTLLSIFLDEFKPTKIHDVDVKAQVSKFLRDKRTERNDFSTKKNKLKTKKTLTDGEVRDLAREFVESRIRIDEELYRGLRGFSNLPAIGLSERDLVAQMREKTVGMGDRRIMLLQNKMTEKPMLDPTFIEDVMSLEGGVGADRLNIFQQEVDRLFPTRFMQLDP